MKVEIKEVGFQILAMSLDDKPTCEFIFDGDEVTVTDQNGAPILDEDKAIEYLRILMEEAEIELIEVDSDDESGKVEFMVRQSK